MDFGRIAELNLRLQHEHSDGTWGSFEPVPSEHHESSAHDPERDWLSGKILRCKSCDEEVHVETVDDPRDPRT
jgi:hypothetical protein